MGQKLPSKDHRHGRRITSLLLDTLFTHILINLVHQNLPFDIQQYFFIIYKLSFTYFSFNCSILAFSYNICLYILFPSIPCTQMKDLKELILQDVAISDYSISSFSSLDQLKHIELKCRSADESGDYNYNNYHY